MDVAPKGSAEAVLPVNWPSAGAVSFKKVNLRYRPECDKVLNDLEFEVKAGHKIRVVGRTGAGKSTMCLVLSRIIELESGTISIDGVEASKVSLEKLREKITVIPQDPVIFDGNEISKISERNCRRQLSEAFFRRKKKAERSDYYHFGK